MIDTTGPIAVSARGVSKRYDTPAGPVVALDAIDLDIGDGRFTAVMGPSGSGKSTLLHCLSGLDRVSAGQIWIGRRELTAMGDAAMTDARRDHIGFVFQSLNLIPALTAHDNIVLPLRLARSGIDPFWLSHVTDTLGITTLLDRRPAQLSGGQQQRVALARATITRPSVIYADEPTGSLDTPTGTQVLAFLRSVVDDMGQTLVMVTHDAAAAATADRVVFLRDGVIVDDLDRPGVETIHETLRRIA